MISRRIALALAWALICCTPAAAVDPDKRPETGERLQDFSFYGLHFRMSKEQAGSVFTLGAGGTEVLKPGHGMMFLTLGFDNKGRLMEIRAAYPLTGEPLADEGRRRALKEKFVQPLSRFRNLSVTLDEYANRAAITLVIISQDLREEVINDFKNESLKLMQ